MYFISLVFHTNLSFWKLHTNVRKKDKMIFFKCIKNKKIKICQQRSQKGLHPNSSHIFEVGVLPAESRNFEGIQTLWLNGIDQCRQESDQPAWLLLLRTDRKH